MASHPMPHSFAKVADERGRHLTSPLTQHEELRRYEFGLERSRDRRTHVDGCGSGSLSSRLVAAHELSPSGQNWTAWTGIVLPHCGHDN